MWIVARGVACCRHAGSEAARPRIESARTRRRLELWAVAPMTILADGQQLVFGPQSPTVDACRAAAEALLPSEDLVLPRNAAITTIYARLYLSSPDTFKWAGFAALASHQMGLALRLLGRHADDCGNVDLAGLERRSLFTLRDDLNLIRKSNNAVYRDVAWYHLAYGDRRFGIDYIRRVSPQEQPPSPLRAVFTDLHMAREREDAALTWAANRQILKHEQFEIVQPRMSEFDALGRCAVTLLSFMDFDANHSRFSISTASMFPLYMCTRGLCHLIRTLSPPDISNRAQRWRWISRRLLSQFERLDAEREHLISTLTRLASAGETA